jgi:predicted extracellular nuclease
LPSKPLNQTEPNFSYYTVRDNGLIIPDIQFTLNSNGSSPFSGETVTVTGYATSSTKQFDLGYVYIQDPNYSEWAGIALRGTNQLTDVFRGEEVTVTGQVVESFGFTMIDVLSLTRTGNVMNIPPVSIDPADSAAYASGEIEKYEGMLVRAELAGSQVWITEENLGFGDYAISSEQGAPLQRSMRVLAGRQSNTAQSSLYASLVTDTFYVNADGIMEVPAITVSDTMNMDAVIGLLSYGFSNYRILPRNNDDFVNINVPLDSTDLVGSPFSIEEINSIPGVSVYPNPNNGSFRIGMESVRPMEYRLLDFQGRLLRKGSISRNGQEIQAFDLPSGLYFLLLEDSATEITAIEKIIIRK